MNLTEEELVVACKRNDRKGMEALYRKYLPRMRAVCFRYCRSALDVEDLLQETFIKVFSKINTFSGDGCLEGWIRKICVNTAINHYHKNLNQKSTINLDDARESELEAVEITDKASVEDLIKVINKLPDGYRMVFNLVGIEGYSHKEAADILKISEATSRSQYTRARKHLIQLLSEKKYEPQL